MPDKCKILVVDDDLAALELISQALESLDTMPKCMQSSRAAAELIEAERFDAVFLDWMMPEMDGLEVARHIRQSESNRTVTIVMLTANTEPEAMQRAFEAGVTFFLTKPLSPAKVRRLLNVSRGTILAERRRHRRVSVSLDVLCAWDGERIRGKTVDLSGSGLHLLVEKIPPPGVSITLALSLPAAAPHLELVGNVVHAVRGTSVGVRFTKSRPADRARLAEFVEKMAETLPPEKVF